MTPALTELGWDETWAQHPRPDDTDLGRVIRADRDRCIVAVAADDDGLSTVTATHSGVLRREHRDDPTAAPVTGDWVALHHHGDRTEVTCVLPRRTVVRRSQVDGTSHGQVLAANADVVAILLPAVPVTDPLLAERMIGLAWASGARPVVVLTKSDLATEQAADAAAATALAPGVDVLITSAVTGTGLDPLRRMLADGATVALLGVSGAGKSTLLNALVGRSVMDTGGLQADGTGRHTTVTRELHPVPGGGAVLDTPGLRTVGVCDDGAVADVFAEITALADHCRFRDCRHDAEPGCAVLAALETGALDARRLAAYRSMLREARYRAARTDARVRAEMVRVHKARTRDYRRRPDKRR